MDTALVNQPMAWTHQQQRIKFTSNDCINLKSLWKMLILDNNNHETENIKTKNSFGLCESIIDDSQEEQENMSLLKFFAINALELSAPASPVLLQQQQSSNGSSGWLQLSGHPESIAPAPNGTVRKRISGVNDLEAIAYRGISCDIFASKIVPKFHGVRESNGETYLELQDLLQGFKDPAVMDIKMGRRTFSESDVISNTKLRNDLYRKMISVAPNAPTAAEHEQQAVTKLRYMLFREQMSSSESKGFRIEALRMKGSEPITDLKTVKSETDVYDTIAQFLNGKRHIMKELLKRLKQIRTFIEKSAFFQCHEIVGSSIFIVYDEEHVGAWLIDFAKSRLLNGNIRVDHRRPWIPGNCEEGLLFGIDELIKCLEEIIADQPNNLSTKFMNRHYAKKIFTYSKIKQ